jgi:hypothetical protein
MAVAMKRTNRADADFSHSRLFAEMSEACAVKLHGTPEILDATRATVDGGPAQCAWM